MWWYYDSGYLLLKITIEWKQWTTRDTIIFVCLLRSISISTLDLHIFLTIFFFFFNLRMKSIHCEEYWCTNKEQHSFHKNRKFPIFLDAKCRYVFTEWQQPYNGTCVIIYACFGLSFKLQKMWSLFFASISWIAKLTSHDYNSFVHHEKMELFTFSLVLFS